MDDPEYVDGYSDSTLEDDVLDDLMWFEAVAAEADSTVSNAGSEPDIHAFSENEDSDEVDYIEIIDELEAPVVNESEEGSEGDNEEESEMEAVAEEPAAMEPPAEEPAAMEPPAEEPAAMEPPAEEPAVMGPPAEEPAAIEPPAEQPVAVEIAPTLPLEANGKGHEEKKGKQLSGKRKHESDTEDDVESRAVCTICLEQWTNAGDHRLVCLRCGHLFGYSCIVRWLDIGCFSGQKRCPQCNKKANKRDIRTLYVHNLQVLDTTECEKLKKELALVKEEKRNVEMKLYRMEMIHEKTVNEYEIKIKSLQRDLSSLPLKNSQPSTDQGRITRMSLENSLEISNTGGCRVLTYNSFLKQLFVSHGSNNPLYSGHFFVGRVDMQDLRPVFGRSISSHTKAIRDLAVRPQSHDLLLSVSLDKTAKVVDLSSNSVINKVSLESPIWSCCWDSGNLNNFFVGCQNGCVFHFDSRQSTAPLNQLTFPGDMSPVTTLVSLPYCTDRVLPQGGLLVSKLVSCWAYTLNSSGEFRGQQLPLEGPFTSLCHDGESDNILVSRRPNANNRNICHMFCELHQEGSTVRCNPVHTFLGGTAQMQLSRPCFMKTPSGTLVAEYDESNTRINAWSTASGRMVATVRAQDPVKDLCAFNLDNRPVLSALSEKVLRIYSLV